MSWDGSVFYELVVGIISLFGVIERQFECMGETLSLFSSLDTGGGGSSELVNANKRLWATYEDVYTPGTRPRKTTQRLPIERGSPDIDGINEDSVEGEEVSADVWVSSCGE